MHDLAIRALATLGGGFALLAWIGGLVGATLTESEATPVTFRADVLTLYPDMFPGPLGQSLAGKALQDGAWSLEATNIRDFATDKHRSVDDTPAGGGAGMVLKPMCSPPHSTAFPTVVQCSR